MQGRGAQVCADRNKPDGQFVLPGQLEAVNRFMRDLPIRKVPGIGKVLCTATPCPRRSAPPQNHTGPITPLKQFTANVIRHGIELRWDAPKCDELNMAARGFLHHTVML